MKSLFVLSCRVKLGEADDSFWILPLPALFYNEHGLDAD